MVHAITEGEVDNTVCSDLRDGGYPTRLEGFAQARDKVGGRGSGCSGVLRDMTAETRVDYELSAVVWFCEFEQEYPLRGR